MIIPTPEEPKETRWTKELSSTFGNESPAGKKALQAIERLVNSEGRDIDPLIIRGFNQNGRWAFIDKLESLNPPYKHQIFLSKFILPREKRTKKEGDKIHLLTNYINIEDSERLDIPYTSIEGCLIVKNSFYINTKKLEKVSGKVHLERAKSFKAPNLKEVNGEFNLRMALIIEAPRLKKINGELDIFYAKVAKLKSLKDVDSLKIVNLKEEGQKELISNLSLNSLNKVLKDLAKTPTIQNDKIKKLVEETIKIKKVIHKVLQEKTQKVLDI